MTSQKRISYCETTLEYSQIDNLPLEQLTQRELEVLTLTAHGKNRHEVSVALGISEETVKVYIERARQKLCAINKTHAATLAVVLGLITPYQTSERLDLHLVVKK